PATAPAPAYASTRKKGGAEAPPVPRAVRGLQSRIGYEFEDAAIGHVDRDIEDDGEAAIGDPSLLLQQVGDEVRCKSHQRDGQDKAENKHHRVLARGSRNCQYII